MELLNDVYGLVRGFVMDYCEDYIIIFLLELVLSLEYLIVGIFNYNGELND